MGAAAPLIGIFASGAGALQGAQGAEFEAEANRQASLFRAQVARNNKDIALARADDALRRGRIDANIQRDVNEQLISRSRAGAAARGVEVSTGSAGQIEDSLAAVGARDLFTIRDNAAREALGLRQQAAEFEAEARLEEQGAAFGKDIGRLNRNASLIEGAGSVSSKWYTFYGER